MLTKHKTVINISSDGDVGINGSDELSIFKSFRLSKGPTM